MGIALDKAELIAIFLETFLYGTFFTLFWATFIVLKFGRHVRRNRVLLPVSLVMITFGTVHLLIDFVRIIEAFVVAVHTTTDGAIGYYSRINHPLHVAKTVFYVTQTAIGDSVIAWRCWMVWGRKPYIAIPAFSLCLINIAIGYVVAWTLHEAVPGSTIFNTGAGWITSFFVLTMVTNMACTVAIVVRLRLINTQSSFAVGRSLVPVAIIIVESGALYASGLLALMIAYLTGTNGQYPALDVITPLVGIVFCLIVLQIRFHVGKDSTMHQGTSTGHTAAGVRRNATAISGVPGRNFRPGQNSSHSSRGRAMELYPVHIEVSQEQGVGFPNKLELTTFNGKKASYEDKTQIQGNGGQFLDIEEGAA